MKRLIFDLDNTVCTSNSRKPSADASPFWHYENAIPNEAVIEKLRHYKESGFAIVIYSSRNMQTFSGSIGLINAQTLPIILNWLDRHNVPYDEVYVGKPWCGDGGFYVDDRAVRPSEFARLSYEEIISLLDRERVP